MDKCSKCPMNVNKAGIGWSIVWGEVEKTFIVQPNHVDNIDNKTVCSQPDLKPTHAFLKDRLWLFFF